VVVNTTTNNDDYVFEIGQVVAGVRTVLATGTYSTPSASYLRQPISVEVTGTTVNLLYSISGYVAASSAYVPPVSAVGVSHTFPAGDPLTRAANGTVCRVGLMTRDGSTGTFGNVGLMELGERWYRLTTLGDGRVGDQVAVRVPTTGGGTAASRPVVRTLHSSYDSSVFNDPADRSLNNVGDLAINTAGFYLSGGTPVAVGSSGIGGPQNRFTLVTLDLSSLLGFVETPELVEQSYLTMPPSMGYNGGSPASGTFRLDLLDGEPGQTPTLTDAAGGTDGPYQTAGPLATVTFTSTGSGAGLSSSPTYINLRQVIQDALCRGRTRVGLKLSGGPTAAPLTYSSSNPMQLTVYTAARGGVVVDVYDAAGGRLAAGVPVADMRDFPAGDYYVRVYDPLQPLTQYIRRAPPGSSSRSKLRSWAMPTPRPTGTRYGAGTATT
jgi:hypothetical protein